MTDPHALDRRFGDHRPSDRFGIVAEFRAKSPAERLEYLLLLQGMSRDENGGLFRDERLPQLVSEDQAAKFLTRIEGGRK